MPAARQPGSGLPFRALVSDSDSAQSANKGRSEGRRAGRQRLEEETGRYRTGGRDRHTPDRRQRQADGSSASDMTRYTITYFPVHGRAETVRLLLVDQGAKWTDEAVPIREWLDGKCDLKKQTMFGQLPKFSDGDFVLYQSNAILRYLAREYGLYGKSDKEAALIDMMNDGVEDIRMKFSHLFHTNFEAGKEKYIADLPNQFHPFEGVLAKSPGGFLVGDQISFADYNLFHVLLIHLELAPDCLDAFPHLKDYVAMMESRPKIKAYMESEAYKSRPVIPKL